MQQPAVDDIAVKIENLYYNSKGIKDSDSAAAISGFQELFDLAQAEGPAQSDWAFKALKQTVKLYSRSGDTEKMVASSKPSLDECIRTHI